MKNHNPPPSFRDTHNRRSTRRFSLFCVWLIMVWLFPAIAAEPDCPVDGSYVTYENDTGELYIPALEIFDTAGQSQGVVRVQLQWAEATSQGTWFEVVSATPIEVSTTGAPAHYDEATGSVELNGYILGTRGEIHSFNNAKFVLNAETGRFLMEELVEKPFTNSGINAPVYAGTETTFTLQRGSVDQFLLPVEIGNQTFNLLVDTGSDALLVFEDKLSDCNRKVRKREDHPIHVSDTVVSKSYASGTRTGVLATAPVRIGAYAYPDMQIMVIQTPDSQNDPSLTAKGADGVIGLRRTGGLDFSQQANELDAPLNLLKPLVSSVEFNLPPTGEATLAFGKKPLLEQADEQFVFRAKALSVADPNLRSRQQDYSDLQIPFRIKSSFGEANEDGLDILLDTGAVSKLVLDVEIAEKLGYNANTEKWAISADEEIELNLIGLNETTTLYPKFKVSEISVAPYKMMGMEFEAVLGISRWQE
jgi:predicted aspartyl protease